MKRHTRFPRWPSPLLLCAMLLLLTGCGKKTAGDARLLDDLNASDYFLVSSVGVQFSKLTVDKRLTDEAQKSDQVYVTAEGENDLFTCSLGLQMNYTLYNDGWLLDSVEELYMDTDSITPKSEPTQAEIDIALRGAVESEDFSAKQISKEVALENASVYYTYEIVEPKKWCDRVSEVSVGGSMSPHSYGWALYGNEESYHWDYSRILGYWNAWQTGSWDRNYEIILIIKDINTSKEEITFSYTLRDSAGNCIDHEESTVPLSYLSPISGNFAASGDYCTIYIGGYYGVRLSQSHFDGVWLDELPLEKRIF